MAETTNTQTTGYECVGIEKIEQTYEGLYDNKPNIITIYLTNGDTHQFKVMNGSQGVGIDRIEQRQSSSVSGGRNEFAIILTNGKEYTFSTYNGSGGSGSSGSFNQVLQHLNNLLMPSGKSYLYYNGSGFEWKSPDGSTGGGTADLSEYSWWGRKFAPASKMITGEMSAVTSIEFQSTKGETTIVKKLYLDENGDLCFNGNLYATGGITALGSGGGTSGGGTSSSLKLLEVLNKNGSTFFAYNGETAYRLRFGDGLNMVLDVDEYVVTATGGSGSGVTLSPVMSQMNKYLTETTSNTPQFLYWNGTTYTWKNESEISGGSGPSSRIDTIKLFNSLGNEFDSVYLGTGTAIGFMQGDNVTLQAVVKDNINVIKISADGGNGGSSGSVDLSSYLTKTEASITYAAKSHNHSVSDIPDFTENVKTTKVNNATNADKATQLANSRTIWGQSFNGTGDINGHLYMGTAGGNSIQLYMNNGNMLDRTVNTLHIGYGLKESSDGGINLDAYRTVVYTDNMSRHYDFKSNVFDVNTNAIHFGSGASGGTISWDRTNNAFKIEGNVYATGGITALGVSNNVTTNNVDFTFKSVTANTFNVIDSIQLSDGLKLNRNVGDIDLVSIDGNVNSLYLDGEVESYYLSSDGGAYFNTLGCERLDVPGCSDFKVVDANDRTFTIQFQYNGKTYRFTPSDTNVGVS